MGSVHIFTLIFRSRCYYGKYQNSIYKKFWTTDPIILKLQKIVAKQRKRNTQYSQCLIRKTEILILYGLKAKVSTVCACSVIWFLPKRRVKSLHTF